MGNLNRLAGREVPYCPICEGPCRDHLELLPHAFPDRLPQESPERRHDSVEGPPAPKPNPRGKRMVKKPEEDRMVRGPEADR